MLSKSDEGSGMMAKVKLSRAKLPGSRSKSMIAWCSTYPTPCSLFIVYSAIVSRAGFQRPLLLPHGLNHLDRPRLQFELEA